MYIAMDTRLPYTTLSRSQGRLCRGAGGRAALNGARRCQGRAPQEHGGAQIFAPDQERERDRLIRLVPKGDKKDPPASCQRVLFCARYCDSQVAIVLQRGKGQNCYDSFLGLRHVKIGRGSLREGVGPYV